MGNSTGTTLRAALLVGLALLGACRENVGDGRDMPIKDIKTVMEAHVERLMALEGVTAVAIGALDDGTPCIKVYVVKRTNDLEAQIPKKLEGHPVVVEESGIIKPMEGGGG